MSELSVLQSLALERMTVSAVRRHGLLFDWAAGLGAGYVLSAFILRWIPIKADVPRLLWNGLGMVSRTSLIQEATTLDSTSCVLICVYACSNQDILFALHTLPIGGILGIRTAMDVMLNGIPVFIGAHLHKHLDTARILIVTFGKFAKSHWVYTLNRLGCVMPIRQNRLAVAHQNDQHVIALTIVHSVYRFTDSAPWDIIVLDEVGPKSADAINSLRSEIVFQRQIQPSHNEFKTIYHCAIQGMHTTHTTRRECAPRSGKSLGAEWHAQFHSVAQPDTFK